MKGWKTVIINGAVALIPMVDTLVNNGALVSALLPHAGAVLSVLGLVNVVLRWTTTSPIFKPE